MSIAGLMALTTVRVSTQPVMETPAFLAGLSVIGGYDSTTWIPTGNRTPIRVGTSPASLSGTQFGPVTIGRLEFIASFGLFQDSFAVTIANAGSDLTFDDCGFVAANGGGGAIGRPGTTGAPGQPGVGGSSGGQGGNGGDPLGDCVGGPGGPGGIGGNRGLGGAGAAGGNGGGLAGPGGPGGDGGNGGWGGGGAGGDGGPSNGLFGATGLDGVSVPVLTFFP